MTEKKPIESARTIGTECLSLLVWACALINAFGLMVCRKIIGIENNVNRGAAWAGLVLACWILWPAALVICIIMVFGYIRRDKS